MLFNKDLLSKVDRAGIVASALVFLISSSWLIYDSHFSDNGDNAGLIALGKINPIKNQTRRRHAEGFTWFDVHQTKPVYNGDFIYTGADANAEITLDDGSTIRLEPSTLIVLNFKDKLNLDLQFGSFSGDLKNKSEIKIGGETLNTDASNFSIAKNTQGLDIDIKTGALNSGVKKLGVGSSSLNQGKVFNLEKSIDLLYPKNTNWVWLKPNQKLEMSWSGPENIDYVVELSTTSNFEKVILSETSQKQKIDISFSYFQTEIFWRVIGLSKDQKKYLSPVQSFVAHIDLPPEPLKPLNNQNLLGDITDPKNPKGIDFSWKDLSELWNEFELQISDKKDFSEISSEFKNIKDTNFTAVVEKTGEYFWRVRGHLVDKNHSSPWSESRSFFIRVTSPDPLKPPALINNQVTYNIIPRDLVNYDETQNVIHLDNTTGFPKLDWTPVEHALGYKLSFAQDKAFTQIIKTVKVKQDQYSYMNPFVQDYFWVVQTIYKDGSLGPLSTIGSINVRKPYPLPSPTNKISEAVDFKEKDKIFEQEISWDRFPLKKGYEVQWSTDKNFKQFERTLTVKDSLKVPFNKSSEVYWRVRASNRDKSPFSPFSPTQTISYERKITNIPQKIIEAESKQLASMKPPVDAPTIIQPTSNKVYLTTKTQESFVLMKWEYPKDFDLFQIEVSSDRSFEKIITQQDVTDSKWILNKKLSPGEYFWRVRAKTGAATKEWTEVHSFKIKNLD